MSLAVALNNLAPILPNDLAAERLKKQAAMETLYMAIKTSWCSLNPQTEPDLRTEADYRALIGLLKASPLGQDFPHDDDGEARARSYVKVRLGWTASKVLREKYRKNKIKDNEESAAEAGMPRLHSALPRPDFRIQFLSERQRARDLLIDYIKNDANPDECYEKLCWVGEYQRDTHYQHELADLLTHRNKQNEVVEPDSARRTIGKIRSAIVAHAEALCQDHEYDYDLLPGILRVYKHKNSEVLWRIMDSIKYELKEIVNA